MVICWERAVLLALFGISWWSSAGKELSSWLCLGYPGGHLLGKSCPLGFVWDILVVICWKELSSWLCLRYPGGNLLGKSCPLGFVWDILVVIYWERAVLWALFGIFWWSSTGKELSSWLCLGYPGGHLGKSSPLGFVWDILVFIYWERAVLLALFGISWWSSTGKELSSWLCLGYPGGHLLGKSCPLGFVWDILVVICWERAVLLALFGISWWSSTGKELSSWLCLGYPGGHLLGKSCPLGFIWDILVVIYWERAVLLALFGISWWSSTGKELSSWLCLGYPGGNLLGKSSPLGFVWDILVVIYWERAVLLALFGISWWSSTGKELSSWLCLGYPGGHLLGKSCPLGFVWDILMVIYWERAVLLVFCLRYT